MPILKKTGTGPHKQIFTSLTARRRMLLVKVLSAALFALLLLTVLPAAMPDTHEDQIEETTRFDQGIEYPVPETTPEPIPDPGLVVVYSERDDWSPAEAELIEILLKKKIGAKCIILSDSEYDPDTPYFDGDPVLTVNVGITNLLQESYLDVLARLGSEGLEVVGTDGRIDIISASSERVREAIQKLAASISYDGVFEIDSDVFFCDARPSELSDLSPALTVDGDAKILVFSHIDGSEYTLRALEGIISHAAPDLVVFNGGVDGGASSRAELSDIWEAMSAILNKTSTPWCFTPGKLTGKLSRITVCEVISSFDGCILPTDGDEVAHKVVHIGDTNGRVTSSIYIADLFGSAEDLCARIEFDSAAFARATDYKRAVTAILPALPKQLCAASDKLPGSYVSDKLTDIFDSLEKAGSDVYVCAADPINPAVEKTDLARVALCGSIGFDSLGLGGRFDYNNSLRGGVLLTLSLRRADYTEAEISYIYAADLGLTKR